MYITETQSKTQKVVQTGLFIAIGVILHYFSRYTSIYIAGIESIRISLAGPFTKLPAILFGPLFGAASGGLVDILGFITRPSGGYIPWITLTAILDGLLTALIWRKIRFVDSEKLSAWFAVIFGAIGLIGIANHLAYVILPGSRWVEYIAALEKKGPFATTVLEAAALIGLIFLFVGKLIKARNHSIYENYMRLLVAVGVGGLVETTLNTWILQLYFAPLAKMGFLMFYIPRLIQELVMTMVQSYLIAVLLIIYYKLKPRTLA